MTPNNIFPQTIGPLKRIGEHQAPALYMTNDLICFAMPTAANIDRLDDSPLYLFLQRLTGEGLRDLAAKIDATLKARAEGSIVDQAMQEAQKKGTADDR